MGVGVSEVVGVRRNQMLGVRSVVYAVVEEERGYTGALWFSHRHVSVLGGGVVVTATGHPPLEVGGQPAHCAVSECGVHE